MIKPFRCADTARRFSGRRLARFASISAVAERKLQQVEETMAIPAPKKGMRPVHPGAVLREEYLKPLGLSANALTKALRVPASRVNDIALERRGITVDTAFRLVRYFGGDVQRWLNLQTAYDLKVAERTIAAKIAREVDPKAA